MTNFLHVEQQQPIIRNVDRPEISEAFSDSIGSVNFDGATVKIEFKVARIDPPNPPNPPSVGLYTAARVVLSVPAMLALLNSLQQAQAAMQQQGVLKTVAPATETMQ